MTRRDYARTLWAAKLARQLTPSAYLIGRALLRYADRRLQCFPSLATLAEQTGCCVRTVVRAIQTLRRLGLLEWTSRKTAWNRRESNRYTLLLTSLGFVTKARDKKRIFLESSRAKESSGSIAAQDLAAQANARRQLAVLLGASEVESLAWLGAGGR